jgi:hypothetical protein
MKLKLYRVHIGLVEDEDECNNWSSTTVIAGDAASAIKRARLRKNEYPASVELISAIDRP